VRYSVCNNGISGKAAKVLVKVVLAHGSLATFCDIPITLLRQNTVTNLDLKDKGIGVPGAIVLANLLPAASALLSLK
jgi:hypothetical protein